MVGPSRATGRSQIVKAIAVIRRPRDGALLVSEDFNPAGAAFHRPLGGHVEYGEYAQDTVQRELAEEIGQTLANVRLLCVLENIFDWGGALRHEVVFVFAAALADESGYEIAEQRIRDEPGSRSRVIWRTAGATTPPLYPPGVADW